MRSRSCLDKNSVTLSGPKVYETPLSFSPHPCTMSHHVRWQPQAHTTYKQYKIQLAFQQGRSITIHSLPAMCPKRHTTKSGKVVQRTCICLSGSAHNKSHKRPVSGTSVGRGIRLICSSDFNSGERPPCIHSICHHTCTESEAYTKETPWHQTYSLMH